MITKAIIQSINTAGNKCIVRMPLFETAGSSNIVEAEALVSITPGLFNNLFVGDVVFVAFEENALEKPIILGKLFKGVGFENETTGGASIVNSLRVKSSATIPATTMFDFKVTKDNYKDINTPKKMADYLKWLERLFKNLISQLDSHFRCLKNWVQWQLRSENLSVDDGDIDINDDQTTPCGKTEGTACTICGNDCTKNKTRQYLKVDSNKNYPNV